MGLAFGVTCSVSEVWQDVHIIACAITLLACRDLMPRSGLTLERAQEDYEKGLKIEQDFAEYFTGWYIHTHVH